MAQRPMLVVDKFDIDEYVLKPISAWMTNTKDC
jgi:hypothetical protein